MESNRDEAERCIEIAKTSLREAKLDRAEKFLKKAEALFPTPAAKELLASVLAQMGASNAEKPTAGSAASGGTTSTGPKRRQSPGRGASTAHRSEPAEPEYTAAQLELVKRIKKCKDFYEVLGVAKDASEADIKKAYKKLALQLHPDKNKAPGADEGFKAIGNAVATLTDEKKRQMYDLYGKDEFNTGGAGGGGGQQGPRMRRAGFGGNEFAFNRGFESEVTAEELFNMFFGGGFPQQQQQNVYARARRFNRGEQQQQPQAREQSSYSALINLMPILLLITLSMMSSFFISDPIYSLQPSQKYAIHRTTKTFKVAYYVKENFHVEYQGSLGRLETSVEEEHINNLKHSCYREKNYKDSMLARARSFNDRELHRRAQSMATPACDNLQKLQNQ